jgi:hypothetical protein
MTRDDPLLLPICQVCGNYKGVGPCKNSSCSSSKITSSRENSVEMKIEPAPKSCSLCGSVAVVSCGECNRGFCEIHGTGQIEGQLLKWDQRIGTCSICQKVVCENCWILESDGAITCFVHHEGSHKHQA